MSVKIGEAYADILEKVRKSPLKFKQLENAGPLPASTDSILEQIVIRDNLTLENMFDDARLIVFGQLAQSNELITYYNAAIEKLQQDHPQGRWPGDLQCESKEIPHKLPRIQPE